MGGGVVRPGTAEGAGGGKPAPSASPASASCSRGSQGLGPTLRRPGMGCPRRRGRQRCTQPPTAVARPPWSRRRRQPPPLTGLAHVGCRQPNRRRYPARCVAETARRAAGGWGVHCGGTHVGECEGRGEAIAAPVAGTARDWRWVWGAARRGTSPNRDEMCARTEGGRRTDCAGRREGPRLEVAIKYKVRSTMYKV